MDASVQETVTRLLSDLEAGRESAADDLFPIVYGELHRIAESCFRGERANHTLQPTALVNEAFIRLVQGASSLGPGGREQFYCLAARAMRNILIDHARARGRLKRGGDRRRVEVETPADDEPRTDSADLLALDEALAELAALDERKARLVELRFFTGLSCVEAGGALGISRATVAREWRMARAWLAERMAGGPS